MAKRKKIHGNLKAARHAVQGEQFTFDASVPVRRRFAILRFETAKKIGLNACIDKIGREFVRKYADSTATAYGKVDGGAFCFVGVDNRPQSAFDGEILTLDSQSQFPYRASCNVSMADGSTSFFDCAVP